MSAALVMTGFFYVLLDAGRSPAIRPRAAMHAAIARPYGMIVVTLAGDAIAAITWFSDTGVFRHFGLPRTLPSL